MERKTKKSEQRQTIKTFADLKAGLEERKESITKKELQAAYVIFNELLKKNEQATEINTLLGAKITLKNLDELSDDAIKAEASRMISFLKVVDPHKIEFNISILKSYIEYDDDDGKKKQKFFLALLSELVKQDIPANEIISIMSQVHAELNIGKPLEEAYKCICEQYKDNENVMNSLGEVVFFALSFDINQRPRFVQPAFDSNGAQETQGLISRASSTTPDSVSSEASSQSYKKSFKLSLPSFKLGNIGKKVKHMFVKEKDNKPDTSFYPG